MDAYITGKYCGVNGQICLPSTIPNGH